jgi:hypothetical protein
MKKYYIEQKELVHIEGDLFLRVCKNLTSLGSLQSVGGYLFLEGCTNLTSLGSLQSVGISIYGAPKELKQKYKGKFKFY